MKRGNVQVINRTGSQWVELDNSGASDVGGAINALLADNWDVGGVDLFLDPGTYLVETPISVSYSNVGIQGYTFGFSYGPDYGSENRDFVRHHTGAARGREGKTRLLLAPSCRDAIEVGTTTEIFGFTLRNITICGQNGRTGVQPDITPEQNGLRIMTGTAPSSVVVDYCQFLHLTHGIIGEGPETYVDVFYITDNWISECNVAIKLHASVFASVISRNGLHDMSGTVLQLRSLDHTPTKEMVISDNTGWNPGKLVFDIEGFRGGTITDNALVFNHEQVKSFARLRSCHLTHVTGNTFVVDVDDERTQNELGDGGRGYEQDGERYDTLTLAGCSDCTVSGNSLTSFDPEHPVIRLGAHDTTGEDSRDNHLILNKVLPSAGFEGRPQICLEEGTQNNLVVLPKTVSRADRRAIVDRGRENEICALPPAFSRDPDAADGRPGHI